jgi:hypothetical protein
MSQREIPEEAKCPSCGKFVGAYEKCPYCQASLEFRVSLKRVRIIAVAGALTGLILLWIAARYHEVPLVAIGAVDLQYNMATVRLEGSVVSVNKDAVRDGFRIQIDDGTGRATLSGFGKLSIFERVFADQFPRQGDKISAVGNLSVNESWGVTLFLSSPRRLKLLHRPEKRRISFDEITPDDLGSTGIFTGTVVTHRDFSSGITLTLNNAGREMPFVLFNSQINDLDTATLERLKQPGTRLLFRGRIDRYRNTLQLKLDQSDEPDSLVFLEPDGRAGS